MNFVHVLWEDAHSTDAWSDSFDTNPCMCETIGMLVHETDKGISVSHTKQVESETYCCTIHIPKSCIKSVTYLKAIKDGSKV